MEAARKGAATRAAKHEARPEVGTPEVFVTRDPSATRRFLWEIRRHGGLVVERDVVGHPTADAARDAGRARLAMLS